MKFGLLTASALAAMTIACAAKADTFVLSIEAPGVENSTATFSVKGVETFDSFSTGNHASLSSNFGGNGVISGVYSGNTQNGVQINAFDQYGGANGAGNYVVAFQNDPYTLALSSSNPKGINYFGYWLSALDPGNQVAFYNGSNLVASFSPTDVLAKVSGNSAYYGNPNTNPSWLYGKDGGEPFVFLNFYDTNGTFDKIVFSEGSNFGGGYESDNHTVGYYTEIGGTPLTTAVPEPSTWAMMGLGFAGLAFLGHRATRRRPMVAA